MKKLILLGVLLSVFTLSGCNQNGSVTHHPNEKDIKVFQVRGKPLECIKSGYGMSCNWVKYNNQ